MAIDLHKKAPLAVYSLVLSLYTACAFHLPFFRYLTGHLEGGFNGVLLTLSAAFLLVAIDFFVYYLLVFLGRFVGKCIVAFTLFGDAVMLFFVNTYNVLITDEMMGNAINTQYSPGFFLNHFLPSSSSTIRPSNDSTSAFISTFISPGEMPLLSFTL